MKTERFVPAPPLAPGEFLRKEFLAGSGVTQEQLAEAMGVSRFSINQIINGRRSVTPDMALRLASALDTTPEIWLKLQNTYDVYQLKISNSEIYSKIKPLRGAAPESSIFDDRD